MRFSLRGQDAVWYYQGPQHHHVLVDPDVVSRSQVPGFVRPIELWGAAQWSRPPSAPVVRYAQLFGSLVSFEEPGELGEDGPRPGDGRTADPREAARLIPGPPVIDRSRVVDFVVGSGLRPGSLALLMDAVAAAMGAGMPVVLAAPTVEAGAYWIGLLSFLAPPPFSLRLSFSGFERLADALARADAEAGGAGDLISAALQEDDPEGWRTPVLSVVLESDLDAAGLLPRPGGRDRLPVLIVDPRVEATLVAPDGRAFHRTHLGQRVPVTDWSRLALDIVVEEPQALERCLRRLDEVSLSTPPTGGPRGDWWPGGGPDAHVRGAAWFLAAAVALTPGLPLALPAATRIILRDTPPGLQLSDDLAAALAELVSATVDDADQAWTRLLSARQAEPPRPALVQASFESYLYLTLEDDDWLLRRPPPLPGTVRFDPGLPARLRAPLAKLTDRLARPQAAESEAEQVRHGVLLLRAVDFAHRTARLVHGPDLAASGLELLADRAARMLAVPVVPVVRSAPPRDPNAALNPAQNPALNPDLGIHLDPDLDPDTDRVPGPDDLAVAEQIAQLAGPIEAATLVRWIVPHLVAAGQEPGGWLRSGVGPGQRLPAAVLRLLAPAVDADRLSRLRPEELQVEDGDPATDQHQAGVLVGLEVAVASALGRISADPRLRGPAVRHLLRLALDADPTADPEALVGRVFGRLVGGPPWSAALLLQITEPAPERLAGSLVPVAVRHLADWLDDADSARLAAALLKRIDFLRLRDAQGRGLTLGSGVTDTHAQVLNLLAITGPGWAAADDGLHRWAAELLMFADRAWPGLDPAQRRLIAPRVTVAAFAVAIAAEPAQRDTVLRARLPVVPVGSSWREAVPLGLEAALPALTGILRQNRHRLAGEVVIASTRAMLCPGEVTAQALPATRTDVPRLPALPIGPVLRTLVETEPDDSGGRTFAMDPEQSPGARLAGHLAALVEAEIRAATGPVDRAAMRAFWEQALPGARLAADPFPVKEHLPGVVRGQVVEPPGSTTSADPQARGRIRTVGQTLGGYMASTFRPGRAHELPDRGQPDGRAPRGLTPPHGLTPEDRAALDRPAGPPPGPAPIEGQDGEREPQDSPDARAEVDLRRPRGAERAVNRPGWQTWLRSVIRRR